MVKIRYNGPVGTHYVVSPLRRVKSYGLHTRGDIFEVDELDQRNKPDVFVRVIEVSPATEVAAEIMPPPIETDIVDVQVDVTKDDPADDNTAPPIDIEISGEKPDPPPVVVAKPAPVRKKPVRRGAKKK